MNSLVKTLGVALILAGILAGVTVYKKSLTPYQSFEQAMKTSSTVQVHGTIAAGYTKYDGHALTFRITDEKGRPLDVVYTDVKPGNFDQARDVVAIGRYEGGAFHAQKLLVKCPSKYQGAEVEKAYAAKAPAS